MEQLAEEVYRLSESIEFQVKELFDNEEINYDELTRVVEGLRNINGFLREL